MNDVFDTPILFIVWNRYEVSHKVFQTIRNARPKQLFIACDGPRMLKGDDEKAKIAKVRSIAKLVDWDCSVKTLFQKENLGCAKGVTTAINWFFENVDRGIILEDDCVPKESFYYFCQDVLNKFENNLNVTHVNGNNFGSNMSLESPWDYHFTMYPQCWGWATWKRAWENFNLELNLDELDADYYSFGHMNWSKSDFSLQLKKWKKVQEIMHTWDYQWQFVNQLNGNLAVTPKLNLVTNIGDEGTHFSKKDKSLNIRSFNLELPLKHPDYFVLDGLLSRHMKKYMIRNTVYFRIKRFVKVVKKFLGLIK